MNAGGHLVLLVEDELAMRRFLRASLQAHGFRLVEAATVREALVAITTHNPDLVLLDLGLPDGDGIDLTRKIRQSSRVPILVVSARGRESDKVDALDAGADDYLTKPFGMNELLARIRVAFRHRDAEVGAPAPTVVVGDVRIDLELRHVTVGGAEVHLTPIEYRILALLARNFGKLLTHQQILEAVWGPTYASHTHYVRVHMAELRKKLERNPARPRFLLTEPGVGYRLRSRDDPSRG